ncbi:MAG: hypothetical protein ABH807_02255 [Candidatus Shapirobacteria bacterium]
MKSQNRNLPTIALLTGLLLFLLTFLVIKPKIAEIIATRQQIETNHQELALLTQKLELLKRLNDSDLKTKTEKAIRLLPSQSDPANLLAVFQFVAQENQVTLGEIKAVLGASSPAIVSAGKQAVSESTFNLFVEGGLTQVKNFIAAFASTPPLIKIEADLDQDLESKLTTANLIVTTYFLPLPEKIASVDDPLPQLTPSEEKVLTQLANFRDLRSNEESFSQTQTGKANPFLP